MYSVPLLHASFDRVDSTIYKLRSIANKQQSNKYTVMRLEYLKLMCMFKNKAAIELCSSLGD